jgi:hypothetical protein
LSKEPAIAFVAVNLILFGLLLPFPVYSLLWETPWTIVLAFILFEALFEGVIGGGKGLFIIRQKAFVLGSTRYVLWQRRTLTKGHAFIALFVTILGVTFASSGIAETGVAILKADFNSGYYIGLVAGVGLNFLLSLILYAYLKKGYFAKP